MRKKMLTCLIILVFAITTSCGVSEETSDKGKEKMVDKKKYVVKSRIPEAIKQLIWGGGNLC